MTIQRKKLVIVLGITMLFIVRPGTIWANTVTTPCGSSVSHTHYTPDWTAAEKAAIRAALESTYDEAVVIGEATKDYNCHSYAWAGSSEWIGDPGVYIDSYEFDAMGGSTLTWGSCLSNGPSHSGDDTGAYEATSKWGSSCLVVHDWDYGPYGDVEAMYSSIDCNCSPGDDCDW